jgi:ABC-type polysaccharide/polyol phosphate export permease
MAGAAMIDRAERADSFARTLVAMYRYRELLRNLVLKDLKLKYRGSFLGFLWSLANPLMMIAVYTIVFRYFLQVRVEGFVFYLMLGLLAWTFFANSLTMASGAIVDNGGLVKAVFFPRAILPVATVLFNFAQYLMTAAMLLPLMLLIYRVPLSASMLLFPVFLALQLLFTIGISLMLATGTAFFRDIRHFLEIALAVLFWLTPIVYTLDHVPDRLRPLVLCMPVSPFIEAYQTMFFYHAWPGWSTWLLAAGYAATSVVVGMAVMLAHEDKFSEQV